MRIRLTEDTTTSLERQLELQQIDAAFLHPPLHTPGPSERKLREMPVRAYDERPQAKGRAGLIGFPRSEAPVLMSRLASVPGLQDEETSGEANTLMGALILSKAGLGRFLGPADFADAFPVALNSSPLAGADFTLETSVAWRSLDRRHLVLGLVETSLDHGA